MTRFIHDQFAKDYLETLLTPYGTVQAPRRVAGEVRQIDVWFVPDPTATFSKDALGLLGSITQAIAILEPFRNAASSDEIQDCLLKLLEVLGEQRREAKRNEVRLQVSDLAKLWILTPTASSAILADCRATPSETMLGIYSLAAILQTSIVVIHQLPRTPQTLWLRLLGRGTVQRQAIDELEQLPENHPFRAATLELLYSLQKNLEVIQDQDQDQDDQELVMRLAPLYQQDREQAKQEGVQQGVQQGERLVIENILQTRFGKLDESLQSTVEAALALTPDEFTPLLMQLSREELIERFNQR